MVTRTQRLAMSVGIIPHSTSLPRDRRRPRLDRPGIDNGQGRVDGSDKPHIFYMTNWAGKYHEMDEKMCGQRRNQRLHRVDYGHGPNEVPRKFSFLANLFPRPAS